MLKKINNKIKSIFFEEFKFVEVVILMIMTITIGFFLGGFITKKNYGLKQHYHEDNYLKEFINNYNYILENYYGDLNEKELLDKALKTILQEIDDPYASYMDETESSNFDIQMNGSYTGLGVEVGTLKDDGRLIITNIFDDSPAKKAGLEIGDIIIKINDKNLEKLSSLEFSKTIKEQKGSFSLTVLRNEEEKKVELSLEKIILKSVDFELFDNNIGYISISIFADNTYIQMREALEKLEQNNIEALFIDVRSNTGGYLSSVVKILGLFLDSSRVIYQIQDKNGVKEYYSSGTKTKDYKIAILTNSASASASEILTAALKENINAISVGKKTYGKGSAQKLHTLSDGNKYKFTTQKWLTPLGNSIDGIGVDVNFEVELEEKYYDEPSFENDSQLQKAISVLTGN